MRNTGNFFNLIKDTIFLKKAANVTLNVKGWLLCPQDQAEDEGVHSHVCMSTSISLSS